MQTIVNLADGLTNRAKLTVDYDEPYFVRAPLREELLDLGKEIISRPAELPSKAYSSSGLAVVVEDILIRGLWKEEDFEPLQQKLMSSKDANVCSLIVDRLHSNLVSHYGNIKPVFEKNLGLSDLLLNLAERSGSSDSLAQVIEIFGRQELTKDKSAQVVSALGRLISQIEKNPTAEVLASAACCFANSPDQRVSDILNRHLADLSDTDLNLKGQAVLRYLLNHFPQPATVAKVMKSDLNARRGLDVYAGKSGLLETALYLSKNLYSNTRLEFFGLGNLFNWATNRSLSPQNYSEQAAFRYIQTNLRSPQYEWVLSPVLKVLASSANPEVLDYIEKALAPKSGFERIIDFIKADWSYMSENSYRSRPTIAALAYNKDPKAQAIYEKYKSI